MRHQTPVEDRPVLRRGDYGPDVSDLQWLMPRFPRDDIDGDFGPQTENAVLDYQRTRGLDVDGVVGPETWSALYAHKRPLPPPPPPPGALSLKDQEVIKHLATHASIAVYQWNDRGTAPTGYMQGMGLAFAQTYLKYKRGHPAALEMGQARKDSDKDALNIYKYDFDALGMPNEEDSADTMRHLYALMLGHGMRESSGQYCEGRDMSASNVQSDTAEAGLFQTSYNAHTASDPEFNDLMEEYSDPGNTATCYLEAFQVDVSCSSSDWDCYGSGEGYEFQKLCKECPPFAVETAGLTLRNLANHYGPIVRKEVELKLGADNMFKMIQDYVDTIEPEVA